jgi:hypothetical protein
MVIFAASSAATVDFPMPGLPTSMVSSAAGR